MAVKKTRNGGTLTEAAYFGKIRSALRNAFKWWTPAKRAKDKARRPYKGGGRQKWEYQCAICRKWYKGDEVQIDHVVPCGSLKCYDDIAPFLKRLTPENENAFQVLCKECHKEKTNAERKANRK